MRPRESDSARVGTLRVGRFIVWLIYAFVLFAAFVLGLAFFFKLTEANASAGFVDWIYGASDTIAAPFRTIYPAVEGNGGAVWDFSLLFAFVMYLVAAIIVDALVRRFDRGIRDAAWEDARQQERDDMAARTRDPAVQPPQQPGAGEARGNYPPPPPPR